ncbi:tripartite tricarboxylate transporter substrate binding protein [Bordetella sp. BOR01]|uniref:Bug family tripartite tricarboxylate transporter substrate binding protein n=1 Tax=Bordetella sp. BOR01 TaxID=2854779 RepID=UPI001C4741B8|nr:tripartite tricarboxylate transporter substrate binding protein [Bordetella sp. BOR01]MBV7481465.1 tripartite tricarboxylate transporter substrate binding protein [Bordetella sp. BOR01]
MFKTLLCKMALLTAALGWSCVHAGAVYPDHPLRLVVPYAPGGSTDVLARILAERVGQKLGQTVVVVNQPGGGGSIGSAAVARATPDGYTLLMATNGTHAINVSLYSSLPYDPIKDFAPVSLVATVPLLLVVPSTSPVRTLQELVDHARKTSGGLNFGSAGVGSSGHLAAEMLKIEGKVQGSHVPYKGDGPAIVDLMAGRVDFTFSNMPAAVNQVRAGALRPLAVTTAQRSSQLPNVPTVAEAGYPSLQVDPWYGLLVPSGTDTEIVSRLSEVVAEVLNEDSTRRRIEGLGAAPVGTTPQAFAKVIRDDTAKFEKVIQISGATAQ